MFDLNDRKKLAEELAAIIPPIRSRRQPVLEKWLDIHAAWQNNRTRSFIDGGTFKNKIPMLRRQIEKFAVRGAQMVLPSSEYFEVYPNNDEDDEAGKNAEAVLSYLLFLFRKKIRIYSIVKQLFRTYCLYQRAILKTGVKLVTEDGRTNVWPTARAVDPFLWFYWPETAESIDLAQLVVEDAFITIDQYELEVANGRADPINRAEIADPTWPDDIVRRLAVQMITPPDSKTTASEDEKEHKKTGEWLFRSEVWVRSGNGWRFIWIIWNLDGGPRVTRVSTKVYARPSYRIAIAREIPSEQYTSSMGDDLVNLSTLFNDQVNMFMDSQAMEGAGPVAVDPLLGRVKGMVYKPRAIWSVPPDSVKAVNTGAANTGRAALQGLNFTQSLTDSFSGSSPMAEGNTVRNMPRGNAGVSSMLSMSLSDIRDVARSIEEDILGPALPDIMSLTTEFIPSRQLIKIPKTADFAGGSFFKTKFEGDFDLNWVGSLQSQDNQGRAQRMMEFLKNLAPVMPQVMAELQQKGKTINFAAMFKRMWRLGLGEYGADSLIVDLERGKMSPTVAMALAGAGGGSGGVMKGILDADAAAIAAEQEE